MSKQIIKIIIPARNEEGAIAKVIREIPRDGIVKIGGHVSEIIVADNGSTDNTAMVAQKAGARVISVPTPGYGRACLAGVAIAVPCDVIVFLDGDASDYPSDMVSLLTPILKGQVDMVIGSRLTGNAETGALTPQQKFGNALACWLMKIIWKGTYTDLGPFRAIRTKSLNKLNMQAPTFGWTVEMQVRALKHGLTYTEVPVRYRKRIGKSKISGTVSGVILAGFYILGTIAYEAFTPKK